MFRYISFDNRRLIHSQHYQIIDVYDKSQKFKKRDRISQEQIASNEPFYGFKVIQMNSQFLEIVDSSFDVYGKGISILMINFSLIIGLCTWLNFYLIMEMISDFDALYLVFMPFVWLISACFYIMAFWVLRVYSLRELHSYTYRPIRFNRTNGKVYAFDEFGNVHVNDWKRIMYVPTKVATYFTPQKHEMQGFMYRLDGKGYSHVIRFAIGFQKEYCLSQWEFIRRYMHGGAMQFMPNKASFQSGNFAEDEAYKLWYCLDIDAKRETSKVSWDVIQLHNMHHIKGSTIKYTLYGILYLFRRFMMRTAKVPHWPQWVNEECKVSPDDPYIINAENSPYSDEIFNVSIAKPNIKRQ